MNRLSGRCGVAWVLLLWLVILGPLAVYQSFHIPPPQGVLDGDDDDGAVTRLLHLDATMAKALPSRPADVAQPVARAPLDDDRLPPSVVQLPGLARSPPFPVR